MRIGKMDLENNEDQLNGKKWWCMLTIGMGVFMGTLDFSIVNVALPTLVAKLNADFATIQWVVLSYALVITSTMLGAARLGDMWNKKRLYIFGLALFTLGSLFCGLSLNVGLLIGARVIQGCGAVLVQAVGTAILVEVFPEKERGRAMGIIGSVVAVGISLGPAIGGLIVGLVGWRWVFFINIPIGIVAILIALRSLPSIKPAHAGQRFDFIGALVLLVSLCCFAIGMTWGQDQGFDNSLVRTTLLVFAVGICFFIFIEKQIKQPMVDMILFVNKLFSLNLLMSFLSFLVVAGTFLMPFYLELVKNYPPYQVGFLMMVTPLIMGVVSPLSGILSDRFGPRGLSLIGLLVTAGGCFAISTLNESVGMGGYILRMAPLGLGLGIFMSPNNSSIMGSVPLNRLGIASGLMGLSRNFGQTTGLPIMGALFSTRILSETGLKIMPDIIDVPVHALVSGLSYAFRVGSIAVLTGVFLAVIAIWIAKRD